MRERVIEVLSRAVRRRVRAAVDDVKNAAVLGAIFAIIVMWFFLRRLATTFIVGLAIPISVIVTFAPMYMMGVSLNIMSLGGLALGVGMLVDNAIVVLESITRCREEGDDLARAAVRGVSEVAGAITASTPPIRAGTFLIESFSRSGPDTTSTTVNSTTTPMIDTASMVNPGSNAAATRMPIVFASRYRSADTRWRII